MTVRRLVMTIILPALAASVASALPASRPAAEKFIPTFAVCYSDAKAAQSIEETAKFDMLVLSFGRHTSTVWGRDGRNSFVTLRALNPDIVIAIYALGPGEYNTAAWGQIGEGWNWLKENHGRGSANCWTALGRKTGAYLQGVPYPNERLMDLANTNWQRYWCDRVYNDYWGGRKGIDLAGADAVFADNVQYQLIWQGQWHAEGRPDQSDEPTTYFAEGKWLNDQWRSDCRRFLDLAIPAFAAQGLGFIPNFGYMGRNPEYWQELDGLPHPPYAAMEEGGFVCPWGGDGKSFKFWDWEKKLPVFAGLCHTKALMHNHGGFFAGSGLAAKDGADANGMTGWDALWFSLTSFLLGFDDVTRNGFLSFTIWKTGEYHYFDEFDPRYLHLGKAKGPYEKRGSCYYRQFDDGWVVVNPTAEPAHSVPVRQTQARVVTHANFRDCFGTPLVTRFDLPAHRGVVLLSEGRQAGNADNSMTTANR